MKPIAEPRPVREQRSEAVLVALRRIIRAVDLHSKQLERETGLTTAQIMVLRAISTLGEVTTARLSAEVTLSQATVTTILDRLEARGLVERYRSATDRRIVHSRLTASGKKALRKAPPLLQRRFLDAFEAMDVAGQERIVESLQTVAAMMGGDRIDAAPLLDVAPPVSPPQPSEER